MKRYVKTAAVVVGVGVAVSIALRGQAEAMTPVFGWHVEICESRSKAAELKLAIKGLDSGTVLDASWSADDTSSEDAIAGLEALHDSAISLTARSSDGDVVACIGMPDGEHLRSFETKLSVGKPITIDRQSASGTCSCPTLPRWELLDLGAFARFAIEDPIRAENVHAIGHSEHARSIRFHFKLVTTEVARKYGLDPAALAPGTPYRIHVAEPSGHHAWMDFAVGKSQVVPSPRPARLRRSNDK